MGIRPLRPPVTPEEQAAGLREGRDLYREDLERYRRDLDQTFMFIRLVLLLAIGFMSYVGFLVFVAIIERC